MRGRLLCKLFARIMERNTPAYAGKTLEACRELRHRGKHPRVCGEDINQNAAGGAGWETPPRMRGRLVSECHKMYLTRNTPAYAGKTSFSSLLMSLSRKHPRVCGEDNSLTYGIRLA